MGIVPAFDPFQVAGLRWVVARVGDISPRHPTWARPALVRLQITEALSGEAPPIVEVLFDAPRTAGQQYFNAERDLFPPTDENQQELQRRRRALDGMAVEVPEVGATIITWLVPPAAGAEPPLWTIPDCTSPAVQLGMRGRWIAFSDDSLAAVRALLAGARPGPERAGP